MKTIVTMSREKVLLSKALLSVENCCLCLENIGLNGFSVHDEVFVKICNEEGSSLLFIEIISFLLNIAEQQSTITTNLCRECAKNAVSSYIFVKKCQSSRKILQNAIENIESSIHNVCVEKEVANTLFIATNTNNCTCSIYYDKHSEVNTTRDALKRFKAKISKKSKSKKSKQAKFLQPPIEDNDFPDLDFSNSGNEEYDNDGKTICEYCSRTFPNSKGLRAHYVRVHAPKDHKCNECPKTYGAAHLLKLHKTESHMTVMCTECGKTYSNLHSLKMHSFSHTKLACHICGREYKTRNSYRKHMKSKICTQEQGVKRANIEKKYTCDICDKSYAHKGTLQVHINFEHENGKSFTCGWCNKKFAAQSRLKSHIVKHTRERNFTCEICGGKFVTKEALLYHTRIHTGETPYPCLHCDQRFLSASRRMDHMRRKHMGPTLECAVCNSKFKTPSSLAKHKRRHFNPNSRLFTQTVRESVEV